MARGKKHNRKRSSNPPRSSAPGRGVAAPLVPSSSLPSPAVTSSSIVTVPAINTASSKAPVGRGSSKGSVVRGTSRAPVSRGSFTPTTRPGVGADDFGALFSLFGGTSFFPSAGLAFPRGGASCSSMTPSSSTDPVPSSSRPWPICLEREAIIIDLNSDYPMLPGAVLRTINLQSCIAVAIWTPNRAGIIHLNAQGQESEALTDFLKLFSDYLDKARIAIVGGEYHKHLISPTVLEHPRRGAMFSGGFDPVVEERMTGKETSHELMKLISRVFFKNHQIRLDNDPRITLYIGKNPRAANFEASIDLNSGLVSVQNHEDEDYFIPQLRVEFIHRGPIAVMEQKRRENVPGTPYHVMKYDSSVVRLISETSEVPVVDPTMTAPKG